MSREGAGWDLKTEDPCHGKVQAGTLKQRTNVTAGAGWDLKKQRTIVTGGAGWDLETEDQCHGSSWLGP